MREEKQASLMREAMLRPKLMEAKKRLVLDNFTVDKESSSIIRLQQGHTMLREEKRSNCTFLCGC
jgi:hypothetical protein